MWCVKCQNDLADCVCPDLQERLEAIGANSHVVVAAEYAERIRAQAERNKGEDVRVE